MPTSSSVEVRWLPWGADAFARAQATGRPVLLSVVTTWSAACRAMDRDVFAMRTVVEAIERSAVPIRVDADRRPDLAERYTQGGWPTTLFLTPEGDLLAGCAPEDREDPARLATLVTRVATTLTERRRELAVLAQRQRDARREDARSHEATRPQDASERDAPHDSFVSGPVRAGDILGWITDRLLTAFDAEHGGFAIAGGADAKFPLAAPIAFALWQGARTEDARLLDAALITLDRMATSALSAPDGAFHRGCALRDWTEPDEAKLLETQADLIPLYLDAWLLTGEPAYRHRADAALAFVDRTLRDRTNRGGYFASQAPDGAIDRILLTDANARMIVALLRAARVLDDASFLERAAHTIERLVPVAYQRQAGVAHVIAPGLVDDGGSGDVAQVRGLLADQVHASAALFETGVAVGEPAYVELAEELMRAALRKLWRPDAGFADRIRATSGAGAVGLLADPLYPFAANAAAARVLIRLGRDANRPDLLASAHATLEILARGYRDQGISSAELGLALLTLLTRA